MFLINMELVISSLKSIATNGMYWVLVIAISLDYVLGTARAFITKDVNSHVGLVGLIKHSIVLIVTTFITLIGSIAEFETMGYLFTSFYIFDYLISILENLEDMGIPFPKPIKSVLRQWQEKNSNKWGAK